MWLCSFHLQDRSRRRCVSQGKSTAAKRAPCVARKIPETHLGFSEFTEDASQSELRLNRLQTHGLRVCMEASRFGIAILPHSSLELCGCKMGKTLTCTTCGGRPGIGKPENRLADSQPPPSKNRRIRGRLPKDRLVVSLFSSLWLPPRACVPQLLQGR